MEEHLGDTPTNRTTTAVFTGSATPQPHVQDCTYNNNIQTLCQLSTLEDECSITSNYADGQLLKNTTLKPKLSLKTV
jgi:hypothetical protein